MGLFDSETSTGVKFSPGVNNLHDQIIGGAGAGMNPWFKNPTYTPAPMNGMQWQAANGARGLFGQGSGGSFADEMAGLFGGMDTSVGLNEIMGFADPLADMMNERGQAQLGESFARGSSDIGNRQAANNAFSGSGSAAALERAGLNDSMVDATRDMAMGNEASALQFGSGLATGNLDRGLQGLGLELSGLSAADSSRLAGLGFDAQALGLLGAFGDKKQGYDQAVLDKDYTGASRWSPFVPGIEGTQTTNQTPSWMQTGGNILSSLLPFF